MTALLLTLLLASSPEPVRGWVAVGQITVQVSWLDNQLGEVECYDEPPERVVDLVRDWENTTVWPIEMLQRQGIVWGDHNVITGIVTPKRPSWQLYPNPVNSLLYVRSDIASRLELFDVAGRLVYTVSISADLNVVSIDLPSGSYFARLCGGQSRKVTVIR